jgi:hypothetical protein
MTFSRIILSILTLNIMTQSIMTFSRIILSITTFSFMPKSRMIFRRMILRKKTFGRTIIRILILNFAKRAPISIKDKSL